MLQCEACLSMVPPKWEENSALAIVNQAELRSSRLLEWAKEHSFVVHAVTPRRFVVLRLGCAATVEFASGNVRTFVQPEAVCGLCSYQEAMEYLLKNTQTPPAYLKRSRL
jgi:hypothetical protein